MTAKYLPGLFCVLVCLLTAPSVQAALGQDRASILVDHKVMGANEPTVSQGVGYQIHEMQHPSGTIVREFVSPQGQVFAVNWSGRVPTNLQQLLGPHYEQFTKSALVRTGSHHMLRINQPDLVLTNVQYLRHYEGQAYIPAMVPTGVDTSQLK